MNPTMKLIHLDPHEIMDMVADAVCLSRPRESSEALNHSQLDIHARTNERRLQEMMGHLQLSLARTMSMGFLYVIDATSRYHPIPMGMAHSFEVRFCISYCTVFIFSFIKFPSNSTKLWEFYFNQCRLKIKFSWNTWTSAPMFWPLMMVGNTAN